MIQHLIVFFQWGSDSGWAKTLLDGALPTVLVGAAAVLGVRRTLEANTAETTRQIAAQTEEITRQLKFQRDREDLARARDVVGNVQAVLARFGTYYSLPNRDDAALRVAAQELIVAIASLISYQALIGVDSARALIRVAGELESNVRPWLHEPESNEDIVSAVRRETLWLSHLIREWIEDGPDSPRIARNFAVIEEIYAYEQALNLETKQPPGAKIDWPPVRPEGFDHLA